MVLTEFIDIKEIEGIKYYIHENNEFGLIYQISPLDIERLGVDACYYALNTFVESVPKNVLTKVHYRSKITGTSSLDIRRKAMLEDGFRSVELYISFNFPGDLWEFTKSIIFRTNYMEKSISQLLKKVTFSSLRAEGILVKNIDPLDCPFFDNGKEEIRPIEDALLIKSTGDFVNILKLESLSGGDEMGELDFSDLPSLLVGIPYSVDIVTSFQKLNRSVSEADLKIQTSSQNNPKNRGEAEKLEAKEEVLRQVELYGQSIAKIDMSILIYGKNAEDLRLVSEMVEVDFCRVGVFKRQIRTCLRPYLSSRVNCQVSSMQCERSPVVPFFIPLVHHSGHIESEDLSDIAYLRKDSAPFVFNPFNKQYYAHNGLVIGNTGRGKSVFLNTMIDSILDDESSYVILVDVKTSHTALVRGRNGQVHEIDINKASGISAFNLLKKGYDHHIVEHVVDHVVSLCEGSDRLKDVEKAKISTIVNEYVSSRRQLTPSLNDFIEYSKEKNLPNYPNIERWGPNGIYGKVHSKEDFSENRLQYFDLKSIQSAGKGFVTRAVVSSVMTQIYYLLAKKKNAEKLFVFFDETPFFIKNSFTELSSLAKNIRSMNGSAVFTAQYTKDLLGPDKNSTLFTQSSFKILFSEDGSKKEFQELTRVSDENYCYLQNTPKKTGRGTRYFVLKDDIGETRVGLRLTDEEYYRATTDAGDKAQLDALSDLLGINELDSRKVMSYVSTLSN